MDNQIDWTLIREKAQNLVNNPELANRAVKAAKAIIEKYTLTQLQHMTRKELEKTGLTTHTNDLRALSLLGVDTKQIEQERQEYLHFREEYTAKFTRNNIQRTYENYYVPLRLKYPLERLKEGSITKTDFLEWAGNLRSVRGSSQTIANVLACMGIHPSYREAILEHFSPTGNLAHVIELYRKRYKEVGLKGIKAASTKNLTSYYETLTTITAIEDVPNMSPKDAYDFCIDPNKGTLTIHRIIMLECLGYPDTQNLYKTMESEKEMDALYRQAVTELGGRIRKREFVDVRRRLDNLSNGQPIHTLEPTQIAEVVSDSTNSVLAYNLVSHYMRDYPEVMETINALVSSASKGLTMAQEFRQSGIGRWRDVILTEILQKHISRVEANSAYVEKTMNKLEYTSVVILRFIEEYARPNAPEGTDPIRWFLVRANLEDVRACVLAYGRNSRVDNSRVKNTLGDHHAKHQVNDILTFFRLSVSHILRCAASVSSISAGEILDEIENLRVAADASIRRTFLDEEVDAILGLIEDDPVTTLMITIMREVGLRPGAICHLQYRDIVDETHQPRHNCRVLEKGKKYRCFVTGPNLKRKIVAAVAHFRTNGTDPSGGDYIFSSAEDMQTPLPHTTLLNRLKRLALNAGVTDVNFHPHAFRHTIVGKLMDAGNTSEAVSKFLGHSSTDTTMRYYFVKTINEIMDDLRNPFTEVRASKEEEKEERDEDMARIEAKLDAALEIVGIYNTQINAMVQEGSADVHELQTRIFAEVPDLKSLMRCIENSVAGDTVTTGVSIQDFI